MPIKFDMSIEETIEHLDQIAKNQLECADRLDELHCDSTSTRNMVSYHKRLAEWLRELKAYREARKEITRKMNSGQWSEGVVYGLDKAVRIMEKHLREVNADEASDNDR